MTAAERHTVADHARRKAEAIFFYYTPLFSPGPGKWANKAAEYRAAIRRAADELIAAGPPSP